MDRRKAFEIAIAELEALKDRSNITPEEEAKIDELITQGRTLMSQPERPGHLGETLEGFKSIKEFYESMKKNH